MRSVGSILVTILPAAASIAVFGTLYGAGARPIMSPRRSLPLCLIGGVAGYALGELLIS